MSSFKCILNFLTVFVLICAKCSAAIVVTFGTGGTIDLQPNSAGQVVVSRCAQTIPVICA
jgi:hypothetical protein